MNVTKFTPKSLKSYDDFEKWLNTTEIKSDDKKFLKQYVKRLSSIIESQNQTIMDTITWDE